MNTEDYKRYKLTILKMAKEIYAERVEYDTLPYITIGTIYRKYDIEDAILEARSDLYEETNDTVYASNLFDMGAYADMVKVFPEFKPDTFRDFCNIVALPKEVYSELDPEEEIPGNIIQEEFLGEYYWWDKEDTESRIKALDVLIDIYSK